MTPTSVRNKILNAVQYRLKGVVNGSNLYYFHLNDQGMPRPNSQFTGTYAGVPRSFTFLIISATDVTYKEVFEDGFSFGPDTTLSIASGVPFTIADTGMDLTLTWTGTLPVGDVFETFFNTCSDTIRDSYRWDRLFSNLQTPSIVIFPQKERKTIMVNDRYNCTLELAITLWVEEVPDAYLYFEELLADVIDQFNIDVQFGQCLNYDSEIVEVQIEDADGTSNKIGAFIEAHIHYRHAVRDTRAAKN